MAARSSQSIQGTLEHDALNVHNGFQVAVLIRHRVLPRNYEKPLWGLPFIMHFVLWYGIVALFLACSVLISFSATAWADDNARDSQNYTGSTPLLTDSQPDEYQQEIERSAKAYEEATARVEELNANIEDNETLIADLQNVIDKLNAEIPIQQEKSNEALRQIYKLQQDPLGIVALILNADNVEQLLTNLDYLQRIQQMYFDVIATLQDMKENRDEELAHLNETETALRDEKAQAEEEVENARIALEDAQAARQAAQRRAAEEVARLAAEVAAGGAIPDGADWTVPEAVFVDTWAPRIDAYLAGSPMAGLGATFASAAWYYGIDPRWSPAISNTESSNGRFCIKPYNAWGWGAAETDPYGLAFTWSTWEEAIDAHVRGLARGYGYTITPAAAQKYCPGNWEFWYRNTSSEMNKI